MSEAISIDELLKQVCDDPPLTDKALNTLMAKALNTLMDEALEILMSAPLEYPLSRRVAGQILRKLYGAQQALRKLRAQFPADTYL